MNNQKDKLGQRIFEGDIVVYKEPYNAGVALGTIAKFTPKGVTMVEKGKWDSSLNRPFSEIILHQSAGTTVQGYQYAAQRTFQSLLGGRALKLHVLDNISKGTEFDLEEALITAISEIEARFLGYRWHKLEDHSIVCTVTIVPFWNVYPEEIVLSAEQVKMSHREFDELFGNKLKARISREWKHQEK